MVVFDGGEVKFNPIQGGGLVSAPVSTAGLDGLYTTDLTLGLDPAQNIVEARGSAPVLLPTIDPVSGKPSKPTTTLQAGTVFKIWGVKPTVEPNQLVMINSDGYPVKDTEIRFTVLPADYYYSTKSLLLDFYEKDTLQNESWIGFVQADPSGKIILTRGGVKFNPEYTYSVRLIVDRGRKMEVMSDKTAITVAQLNVLTDEGMSSTNVDELKFGDGSKPNKRYRIELKTDAAACDTLNALSGTISTILSTGQTATSAGADYYKTQYDLKFNPAISGCSVKVNDKKKFIVSNLSKTDIEKRKTDLTDTEVLYGGLGGTALIEMGGARKDIPIEPVGVIVLAIDGLRQDVLYKSTDDATNEVSYQDQNGCGLNTPCYIPPVQLKGFCEILGGKYSRGWFSSSCDPEGWENKHIKLKNVTAIFPSITVASWASIFTGKMPKETGIPGNEFFARDLMNKNITWNPAKSTVKVNVPERYDNPAGVISFSSGAFKGYDTFGVFDLANRDFFIPYQGFWSPSVDPDRTPQNDRQILKPDTLYESIVGRPSIEGLPDQPGIPGVKNYFAAKGGDSVVSANSHYARGAYWLTWALTWSWYGDSETLDKTAWMRFDEYIKDRYLSPTSSSTPSSDPRNKIPFSALTVLYLPGLDHEAHILGMDEYRNYFIDDTDRYVKYVVDWLNKYDEFDNKIFIIVADHGMTAMPTNYIETVTNPATGQTKTIKPEASCKLKIDKFDTFKMQAPEQANNNLHIWELGEVMKQTGFLKGAEGLNFAVTAPQEIASLYTQYSFGAKPDTTSANIVAALNGPMAHIYLKNRTTGSWNFPRFVEDTGYMAELLRLTISANKAPSNLLSLFPVGLFEKAVPIAAGIRRLMNSVDMILIRRGSSYEIFNGIKADGSDILSAPLNYYAELGSDLYVRAIKRIEGMNHPDRSGDIVLIFRDYTYDIADNRYTSGVSCKSWHGSLNTSDSYVPFILSYPGGNTAEMNKIMKSVTACPNEQCEGNWNVTDVIKEIINMQYGNK